MNWDNDPSLLQQILMCQTAKFLSEVVWLTSAKLQEMFARCHRGKFLC